MEECIAFKANGTDNGHGYLQGKANGQRVV